VSCPHIQFWKQENNLSTAAVAAKLILPKEEARFCSFCGKEFKEDPRNKKYCSIEHQKMANRRNTLRRLQVPPKTSKLDPLYFD